MSTRHVPWPIPFAARSLAEPAFTPAEPTFWPTTNPGLFRFDPTDGLIQPKRAAAPPSHFCPEKQRFPVLTCSIASFAAPVQQSLRIKPKIEYFNKNINQKINVF
jgi:hypothetical protein